MSIITISRGTYSGGQDLAKRVAEQLGYRCVSRESILEAAARDYRFPAERLTSEMERAPSLWDRLVGARTNHIIYIRAALCEYACEGAIVYHGHVGHLYLTGIPHVLRVRVIADLEYRARLAAEARNISRADALALIKKNDTERRDWVRFLFGVEWDDPSMYDTVVNIGRMSAAAASDGVVSMAKSESFRPTAESTKALKDLALESRVSAELLADLRTSTTAVGVTADAGVVTLKGNLGSEEMAEAVLTVVRQVKGVTEVKSDISISRPWSDRGAE